MRIGRPHGCKAPKAARYAGGDRLYARLIRIVDMALFRKRCDRRSGLSRRVRRRRVLLEQYAATAVRMIVTW
jgi:hypothetical protein